jgi:hypothetical protein
VTAVAGAAAAYAWSLAGGRQQLVQQRGPMAVYKATEVLRARVGRAATKQTCSLDEVSSSGSGYHCL